MKLELSSRKFIGSGAVLTVLATLILAGCGGGSSDTGNLTVTNGGAVDSLLADGQAGGLGKWRESSENVTTNGVTALTRVVRGWVGTMVSTGATSATITGSDRWLTSTTWGPNPDPYYSYNLTSIGWVRDSGGGTVGTVYGNPLMLSGGGTVSNNQDGTMTFTPTGQAAEILTVQKIDLAGLNIDCRNPITNVAICVGPGTYPAGATLYRLNATLSANKYYLNGGTATRPALPVTDGNGVALTALPAPGATFCVGTRVFVAIPGAAAGSDNYNVHDATDCTAGSITFAIGRASTGTILLSNQATGNAVVPSVGLANVAVATSPLAALDNTIIAVRAGNVYAGVMHPAGNYESEAFWNKTAFNAGLAAKGFPTLP